MNIHAHHSSAPSFSKHSASTAGVRLLVVEDDPDQRELISETLQEHFGAGSVELAPTCTAALATELSAFDLILCDYNLPDGNGLDLLLAIRQRCDVPVMMLTGENARETAREAIRRGATDYVVKAGAYLLTIPLAVEKNIVAGSVQREQASATASLEARNQELQQNLRQFEQLAATDAMTGCYNRRAFEPIFEQLFAEAYRCGDELACVMLDLDQFKQINDVYGHASGDALIKLAARVIRANLRQMDVACRYGGDEFILLLPRTDAASAANVSERLKREYITSSAILLDATGRTMSIGIASLRDTTPSPANAEALMVAADRALYQAKRSGRNQICTALTL